VRFNEGGKESGTGGGVKPTGRNNMGVIGMRFSDPEDYIVGAVAADPEEQVLSISEMGLGKRSQVQDYRLSGRGGKGVITLKITEKTGELVSLQSVKDDDELMIITRGGVVIRQKINTIRETGRVAQGVKLINLDGGDKVAAVAKLLHDDGESEEENEGAESEELAEVGA